MQTLARANYKALRKLSMKKKIEALQSPAGQTLYSALTPTQIAELFPRYYMRMQPDVSGFLKAIPSSFSAARQKNYEDSIKNTAAGAAGGKVGGDWVKNYVEDMNKSGAISRPGRRGAGEHIPQLTKEQELAWNKLQGGPLGMNTPEGKLFASLPENKLAEVGIKKVKDADGNFIYQYEAPSISKEQVVERLKSGGGNNNAGEAYRAARAEGLSDSAARAFVANVAGEALSTPHIVNHDPSHSNPNQIAHGIVQWSGPRAEAIKNHFGRSPQEMSVSEQVKAAIWEMKTNKAYSSTWETLNDPNATQSQMLRQLVNNYENPQDKEGAFNNRMNKLANLKIGEVKPEGPNGQYSDRQIADMEARMKGEAVPARREQLARLLNDMKGGSDNIGDNSKSADKLIRTFSGKAEYANTKGNHECVAFPQAHGVGHTSGWSPGDSLMGGKLKPGDWIAAFHGEKYTNTPNSKAPGNGSHAAMFVGYQRDNNGNIIGVKVVDQWNSLGKTETHTWKVGQGGEMDPSRYHQIMDKGKPASMHEYVQDLDAPQPKQQPTDVTPKDETHIKVSGDKDKKAVPVDDAGQPIKTAPKEQEVTPPSGDKEVTHIKVSGEKCK